MADDSFSTIDDSTHPEWRAPFRARITERVAVAVTIEGNTVQENRYGWIEQSFYTGAIGRSRDANPAREGYAKSGTGQQFNYAVEINNQEVPDGTEVFLKLRGADVAGGYVWEFEYAVAVAVGATSHVYVDSDTRFQVGTNPGAYFVYSGTLTEFDVPSRLWQNGSEIFILAPNDETLVLGRRYQAYPSNQQVRPSGFSEDRDLWIVDRVGVDLGNSDAPAALVMAGADSLYFSRSSGLALNAPSPVRAGGRDVAALDHTPTQNGVVNVTSQLIGGYKAFVGAATSTRPGAAFGRGGAIPSPVTDWDDPTSPVVAGMLNSTVVAIGLRATPTLGGDDFGHSRITAHSSSASDFGLRLANYRTFTSESVYQVAELAVVATPSQSGGAALMRAFTTANGGITKTYIDCRFGVVQPVSGTPTSSETFLGGNEDVWFPGAGLNFGLRFRGGLFIETYF